MAELTSNSGASALETLGEPPTKRRTTIPTLSDGVPTETTEQCRTPSVELPLAGAMLPPNVEARLEVLKGSASRPFFVLETTRTVIGRGPEPDVQVNDAKASRRHASIFFTGREFRVRDESSVNGTILNGSRVVEYAIRDGDQILVGETLLRFCCSFGDGSDGRRQ